jgi:hypothetical protein
VLANFVGGTAERNRNGFVLVEVLNATDYVVKHFIYMTCDVQDWLNGVTPGSLNRVLKDTYLNGVILNNSYDDVYKVGDRVYGSFCKIETTTPNTYTAKTEQAFRSRFYERGLLNAEAELLNFNYEILEEGTSTVITEFSQFVNNVVVAGVDDPGYAVTNCWAYLVKTDSAGNGGYFLTELDASEAEIVTAGAAAQLNNRIYSPSQAPTLSSGRYETTFTVPASAVSPGDLYRVIWVFYGDVTGLQDDVITNSFISDEIPVGGIPAPLDLNPTNLVRDYNNEFTGNCYRVVPGERILSRVAFNKAEYNAAAAAAGYPFTDIDTDLVQVQIEIINAVGTVVHTSVYVLGSGSADPNHTLGDDGTSIISSYVLRVPYPNSAGFPDFTSQEFRIRHSFVFQYQNFNNHTDIYFLDNCFLGNTDDCAEDPYIPYIEYVKFQNAETGETLINFCDVDTVIAIVKLHDYVDPTNFNLLVTIDKDPYGYPATSDSNLLEEESYTSPVLLQQKLNSVLFDVDEDFDNQRFATFKIDALLLDAGVRYKAKAYAMPKDPEVIPSAEITVTESLFDPGLGLHDFALAMSSSIGLPGSSLKIEMYDNADGTVLADATFTYGADISSAVPSSDNNFVANFQPYFSAGSLIQDAGTLRLDKLNFAVANNYIDLPLTKNAVDLGLRVTLIIGSGGVSDQDNTDIVGYVAGQNRGSHAVAMTNDIYFTMLDSGETIYLYDLSDNSYYNQQDLDGISRGVAVDHSETVNGLPVVYALLEGLVTSDYSGQLILHRITYSGSGNTFNSVKISAALSDPTTVRSIMMDQPGREWDINGNANPKRVIYVACAPGVYPSRIFTLAWDSSINMYVEGAGLDFSSWNTGGHQAMYISEFINDDLLFYSNNDGINKLNWTNALADNDPTNAGNWAFDPTFRFVNPTSPSFEDFAASNRIVDGTAIVPRKAKFIPVGSDNTRGDFTGNNFMFWATGGNGGPVSDLNEWDYDTGTSSEVHNIIQVGTGSGTLSGAGTTIIRNLTGDKAIQFVVSKNYTFDIVTGGIVQLMPYDGAQTINAYTY